MTYRCYHGSCHCQAVRFQAAFDPAEGSNRCNCSLCRKARAWFVFVRGDAFTLLQGEQHLARYVWLPPGQAAPGLQYRFCERCGIRLFGTGEWDAMGGRFYAVHVPTLDDLDLEALVAAPLRYLDMAHDRPDRVPADTHLL